MSSPWAGAGGCRKMESMGRGSAADAALPLFFYRGYPCSVEWRCFGLAMGRPAYILVEKRNLV